MPPKKPKAEKPERTEICKFCKHAFFGVDYITCRRNAPTALFDISEGEIVSTFPIVKADLWCGEFAAQLSS